MSDTHPLLRWGRRNGMSVDEIAAAAGCSGTHLRNIVAGRKQASLSLAIRLNTLSRGKVPVDAFLKPGGVAA